MRAHIRYNYCTLNFALKWYFYTVMFYIMANVWIIRYLISAVDLEQVKASDTCVEHTWRNFDNTVQLKILARKCTVS